MDAKKSILKFLVKKLSGQFTQLMIFLIVLFIFRPANKTIIVNMVWQLLFAAVLFFAVFNCHHSRIIKTIAIICAIPALLFNWMSFFFPSYGVVFAGHLSAMIFLVVCIWSILQIVVLRAKVTIETLRGAICIYFMIGYFFTLVYTILEMNDCNSFNITHLKTVLFPHSAYLGEMVYFSFATLLAIGYGDIVPITSLAQSFSILEGVTGHFYLAILVARLVAVYSIREEKKMLQR